MPLNPTSSLCSAALMGLLGILVLDGIGRSAMGRGQWGGVWVGLQEIGEGEKFFLVEVCWGLVEIKASSFPNVLDIQGATIHPMPPVPGHT
jgi:hypothetical protein